jgi:hypothetical protein
MIDIVERNKLIVDKSMLVETTESLGDGYDNNVLSTIPEDARLSFYFNKIKYRENELYIEAGIMVGELDVEPIGRIVIRVPIGLDVSLAIIEENLKKMNKLKSVMESLK